ncbi:MAG: hypothetical protein M1826_007690 [Phylliscum demangeonii]|nr:MAG: hypothetical protein M1826_007690 [Phylliscum demangeonii]
MPHPTITYYPPGTYGRDREAREEICRLIRAQGPGCATRAEGLLTINSAETTATGKNEINGTAGAPAINDAHPAISVKQGGVNVQPGCAARLGVTLPWAARPRGVQARAKLPPGWQQIRPSKMPTPTITYQPNNMYRSKPWVGEEICALIRARGPNWATRTKVMYAPLGGSSAWQIEPATSSGAATCLRANEITTCAAQATSVGGVRTHETAETGQTIPIGPSQDGIYGPAGSLVHNNATPVTSRDQGAVNVHPRLGRVGHTENLRPDDVRRYHPPRHQNHHPHRHGHVRHLRQQDGRTRGNQPEHGHKPLAHRAWYFSPDGEERLGHILRAGDLRPDDIRRHQPPRHQNYHPHLQSRNLARQNWYRRYRRHRRNPQPQQLLRHRRRPPLMVIFNGRRKPRLIAKPTRRQAVRILPWTVATPAPSASDGAPVTENCQDWIIRVTQYLELESAGELVCHEQLGHANQAGDLVYRDLFYRCPHRCLLITNDIVE